MTYNQYIVFDFDGTIADTFELGIDTYNMIAPEYDCQPAGSEERELFRSKRPQELLKIFGISKLKLLALTLRIRKEMIRHVPDMKLFNGLETALRNIREAGFGMGILTSNSVENVRKFLQLNNLTSLFDFIYSGRSIFGKEKVIRKMLIREQLTATDVIYVGDETRDIEACRGAGIPVIAVSWGMNRRELLLSMSPDLIVDEPGELTKHIRKITAKQRGNS